MEVDRQLGAADARPSEEELKSWVLDAYAYKLAQNCDQQRAYPHDVRAINAANAIISIAVPGRVSITRYCQQKIRPGA